MIRGNFVFNNGAVKFIPDNSGRWVVCIAPIVGQYHSGLDLNY